MEQKLYLECGSGISGDMLVGALIDLGADRERLMHVLKSVPADGFDIKITRVKKSGLDCCDFDVVLDEAHENHDHDMDYLHGHEHHHDEHHHEEHDHHHDHDSGEQHSGHHHVHRNLADVLHILDHTDMSQRARKIAGDIFEIVAEAESKAHGIPKDEVHFHEVGAIDSIIDIAAIATCIDDLGITEVIVPKLCEGTGTVRAAHGILPVPVPAVANIIAAHKINIEIMNLHGEFVTPTGAAAVAALKTSDSLPKSFHVVRTGIGAGKRTYERPSILRAMLIETPEEGKGESDLIYKLETNIDDSTGEQLGRCMERLFEAGARDAYYSPIYMKKNRPAYELNVICTADKIKELENIIFHETTTIGIRRTAYERTVLPRQGLKISLSEGEYEVKQVTLPDGTKRFYPEYDSVVRLCEITGKTFAEAYALIQSSISIESC